MQTNCVGTAEDVEKFTRRQVRVTKEHNEECRRLLGLMGIPVVVVSFYFLISELVSNAITIGTIRS